MMWIFNKDERRRRKIRRLEDMLADKKHHLNKWGFSMKPSDYRKESEKIDLLQTKLNRLRSENG